MSGGYFARALQRALAYKLVNLALGRFGLVAVLIAFGVWGLMSTGVVDVDWSGLWDNFRHILHTSSVRLSLSRASLSWGLYCY